MFPIPGLGGDNLKTSYNYRKTAVLNICFSEWKFFVFATLNKDVSVNLLCLLCRSWLLEPDCFGWTNRDLSFVINLLVNDMLWADKIVCQTNSTWMHVCHIIYINIIWTWSIEALALARQRATVCQGLRVQIGFNNDVSLKLMLSWISIKYCYLVF